jgi:large subunit ribosomal protein L30
MTKAAQKVPEKTPATTQLKITQVRSTIGTRWRQRESLRTLGLRKIRQSVVRDDNAQTRGLIAVVRHLVEVQAFEAVPAGGKGSQEAKK